MIDAAHVINSRYEISRNAICREPPRYRLLLRSLGAYFDQAQARYVTLAELDGGFFWHFFPHGDLIHSTHGMISYEEVPGFVDSAKLTRIERAAASLPHQKRPRFARPATIMHSSGYEEVFRSLSYKFDNDRVTSILVMEGVDGWAISACLPVPVYVQALERRMHDYNYIHERILTHEHLHELITDVRSYRGRHVS